MAEQEPVFMNANAGDADADDFGQGPDIEIEDQDEASNQTIGNNVNIVAPRSTFALYASMANPAVLDFTTSEATKYARNATKGLLIKFDMKAGNMKLFLSEVKKHVKKSNWEALVRIPDSTNQIRNLIDNYGMVTLENCTCTAHAKTYMAAESRNAQNSVMFYEFLDNSLSENAKTEMIIATNEYTLTKMIQGQEEYFTPGALYLKAIIRKATVDTQATVKNLVIAISKLDQKMVEFNYDIKKFNDYAYTLRLMLTSRAKSESVEDMIAHLFQG